MFPFPIGPPVPWSSRSLGLVVSGSRDLLGPLVFWSPAPPPSLVCWSLWSAQLFLLVRPLLCVVPSLSDPVPMVNGTLVPWSPWSPVLPNPPSAERKEGRNKDRIKERNKDPEPETLNTEPNKERRKARKKERRKEINTGRRNYALNERNKEREREKASGSPLSPQPWRKKGKNEKESHEKDNQMTERRILCYARTLSTQTRKHASDACNQECPECNIAVTEWELTPP